MVFTPLRAFIVVLLFFHGAIQAVESFRIATYNVENYLDEASGTHPAKSEPAKAKVREGVLLITCKTPFWILPGMWVWHTVNCHVNQ